MKEKTEFFDVVNNSLLIIVGFLCVYPFLYISAVSLSDGVHVAAGKVYIIPKGFNFETFKYILSNPRLGIITGLKNSIFYTLLGSLVAITVTYMTAFSLSRKRLKARKVIMFIFIVTWIFEAGIIPNYLVNNALGLVNSIWIMVFPTAISTFLLIITRSFLDAIPEELEESALIDGANDITIMSRIFMPMSRPILATIGIFYAITIWNAFLIPIIYLQERAMQPIQVILYTTIISASKDSTAFENVTVNGIQLLPQNIGAAAIFMTIFPMLLIYPFAQKFFTKGMLLGAVKG